MWAHCSQYVGGPIDDSLRWLLQTALEIFLCMPHAPRCSKFYSRPYAGWPIRATNHRMLVMRPRRAVFEMCRAFLRSQISLKKRGKNESLKTKTEEQRIKTDTIHFSRNFIEARKVRPQVKNDHDSSGNPARSRTPVLRENSTP